MNNLGMRAPHSLSAVWHLTPSFASLTFVLPSSIPVTFANRVHSSSRNQITYPSPLTHGGRWMGKCPDKQGLFPSNHLEKIDSGALSASPLHPAMPMMPMMPSSPYYSPPQTRLSHAGCPRTRRKRPCINSTMRGLRLHRCECRHLLQFRYRNLPRRASLAASWKTRLRAPVSVSVLASDI